MNAPAPLHSFSPATRWIWSGDNTCDAWWMFRRAFDLPADGQAPTLRITASFVYLTVFRRDVPDCEAVCLSREPVPRIVEDVRILPWQQGLDEIGMQL